MPGRSAGRRPSTASGKPPTRTATGSARTGSAGRDPIGPAPALPPPLPPEGSMTSFVERHGLWSDDQSRQAAELAERLTRGDIDVVRFAWADQHGLLRGKTLVAGEAVGALRNGVNLTSTLLAKDT